MKVEQIKDIILEIESEEVAEEFIDSIMQYRNEIPEGNHYNLGNLFPWIETKLGFDFWYNLESKILKYLKAQN